MSGVTLRLRIFVAKTHTKGVTHSSSKTSPTKDSMGETNAESDCESDSIKTEGEVEVGNEEMCALLSPGSHSA